MSSEVNFYLPDNIEEQYLDDSYSARTRTVRAQFAHTHNVRLRWLKHADAELVGEVRSFPKDAQPTQKELKEVLQA